jgi:hypothetical protein
MMTWPISMQTDGELKAGIRAGAPLAEDMQSELDKRRVGRRRSREAATALNKSYASAFMRDIIERNSSRDEDA